MGTNASPPVGADVIRQAASAPDSAFRVTGSMFFGHASVESTGMVASPTVQPEAPGPNLLDAEDSARGPRVITEDRPQLVLVRSLDCKQSDIVAAVAADRSAKDDDASLNEPVEELGMLVPGWLLADPAVVQPV
jgi:hypothetical protein